MSELATSMPTASTPRDQRRTPHSAATADSPQREPRVIHTSSSRQLIVTEEPLPAGVPVLVEKADGTTTIRTDPDQLGPLTPEDLAHIRSRFPGLTDLCNELEETYARNDLQALLDERGAQLKEWDTSELPHPLREAFTGRCDQVDGALTLTFPRGQAPAERLTLARQLLARHAA